MSGRISLIGLLLLAAVAVQSQELPDINRLEVENVRLILFDNQGRPHGVLEGAIARKRLDGQVAVEDARVVFRRRNGSFVLTAPEFIYQPADSSFDSPQGVQVDLPDNGKLTLPAGTGTLAFADGGVNLTMECAGDSSLKTGDETISASIKDPTIAVVVRPAKDAEFELDTLSVTSRNGGAMQLKLARVPSLEGTTDDAAEVELSCFGDTALRLEERGTRASLNMLRRVRMSIDGHDGAAGGRFELTSGSMEFRGDVERVMQTDENGTEREVSSLANVSLNASQNVLLTGEGMRASGAALRYRELGHLTDLRMEGYTSLATIDLDRGVDDEGAPIVIALRSKQYINVLAPTPDGDTPLRQAEIVLGGGARVQRLRNAAADWQVAGRQVRLFSWTEADGEYNYSFDAVAETFEPMLRVFKPLQPGENQTFQVARASVYGVRAEGWLVGPDSFVRVQGPGITAVVSTDFPLAEAVRAAVGLRRTQPAERDPGRLVLRATRQLELGLRLDQREGDVRIAADEAVELDHQPEQRDGSSRLTLTGNHVAFELRDGALRSVDLRGLPDGDALATLGYDLLRVRSLTVREAPGMLATELQGPGRVVVRDADSVAYLTRALSRLPRRAGQSNNLPDPDVGWLAFSGSCRVETSDSRRYMEVIGPTARLLHGAFEKPRAGQSAFNDLAELEGPGVRELYYTTGQRAVLQSLRPGNESDPGVNLLRLEGNALVASVLDGIHATAEEAIEISGAEEQQAAQNPFTALLLGSSMLRIDDAGRFFGDYVSDGALAYDGRWVLHAGSRLELTLRPIDTLFGGQGRELASVRALINAAQADEASIAARVCAAEAARRQLRALIGEPEAQNLPTELAQPARALLELERGSRLLTEAFRLMLWHDPRGEIVELEGARALRRAERLLGVLVDLGGGGGLSGELTARKPTPPLHFTVRDILVTFNGLGDIVAADATGPLEFKREEYAVRGSSLSRRDDGTLELDGAALQLPASTGISIEGVRTVQLTEREVYNGGMAPRVVPVTRVGGPDLRVKIRVGQQPEE